LVMYIHKENAVRVWAAVKPWVITGAEIILTLVGLAIFTVLYLVCSGLAWVGARASKQLEGFDIHRAVYKSFRALGLRKTGEQFVFGPPVILVILAGVGLLCVLALAGEYAEKGANYFDIFGGAS